MPANTLIKIEEYMIEAERVNKFLIKSIEKNEDNEDLENLMNMSEFYAISLIELHRNISKDNNYYIENKNKIDDTLSMIHRFCLFFNKVW